MMPAWLGILLAMSAFGAWFVIGDVLSKMNRVSDELARKFVHIAMGLTCLSFPWVFDASWPVFVLGGLCLVGLTCIKCLPQLGGCLHGVERRSFGEIYFTVGIAILFWWSGGDPLLFCVPVLILTVADAAGALVGIRYGKTEFATLSGFKSAEGSTMFFFAAFMSSHVPLLMFSDFGRVDVLLISLTLAAMVTLVEAISTGGLDNLLIPLGGYYLLSEYVEMSLGMIAGRLLLVVSLMFLVLVLRQRSSLNGGALLGAALLAYAAFALGGWPCLVVLLVIFMAHLRATRQVAEKVDESHTLSAVLSLSATAMLWLILFDEDPVAGFTLGMVAHFAILNFNTVEFLRPEEGHVKLLLRSGVKAVALCYLPLVLFVPEMWLQALLAVPVVFAATAFFSIFFPARPKVSASALRWITQAMIATAVSFAALLL